VSTGEKYVAAAYGVFLVFVLFWVVIIATKLSRLEENLGGAIVQLTPDDLQHIGTALAAITVEGDRYPPSLAARAGR